MSSNNTKFSVRGTVLTALFVAIGLVLPKIFHMVPNFGSIFLPMHLPVLLCGLTVGAPYGFVCGIVTVCLSMAINGMPPVFPIGVCMIAELAAYGLTSGLFYKMFKKVYPALVLSMLAGRIVNGVAMAMAMGMAGRAYTMQAFVAGAFVTALPGIVIQLIVIPPIVVALNKAKLGLNAAAQ